jgi:dTDP-4-amino-4,6-dideoxygalactose transaminase
MGQKFGYKEGDLPNTESISDRLLRLPFYNQMNYEDQTQVIEAIQMFSV